MPSKESEAVIHGVKVDTIQFRNRWIKKNILMKNRILASLGIVVMLAAGSWGYLPWRISLIQTYYHYSGTQPEFRKDAVLKVLRSDSLLADFDIEVARDEVDRQLGLMFRSKMDPYQGMLFIFDRAEPRSFWMKNTYIPLDMLFIGADSSIVDIKKAERLFSTKPVFTRKNARFVLELNLGITDSLGIARGDRIILIP